MARTSKEILYMMIANGVPNGSATQAEKYINSFHQVMLDELKANGEIRMPNWFIMKLARIGGKEQMMTSPSGKTELKYIRPQMRVKLVASKIFEWEINENDFLVRGAKKKSKRKLKDERNMMFLRPRTEKPKKGVDIKVEHDLNKDFDYLLNKKTNKGDNHET